MSTISRTSRGLVCLRCNSSDVEMDLDFSEEKYDIQSGIVCSAKVIIQPSHRQTYRIIRWRQWIMDEPWTVDVDEVKNERMFRSSSCIDLRRCADEHATIASPKEIVSGFLHAVATAMQRDNARRSVEMTQRDEYRRKVVSRHHKTMAATTATKSSLIDKLRSSILFKIWNC